jgi:hypothetical protein
MHMFSNALSPARVSEVSAAEIQITRILGQICKCKAREQVVTITTTTKTRVSPSLNHRRPSSLHLPTHSNSNLQATIIISKANLRNKVHQTDLGIHMQVGKEPHMRRGPSFKCFSSLDSFTITLYPSHMSN